MTARTTDYRDGRLSIPGIGLRLQRTLAFGAGRGRNAAARRATGDLLVFLDADIVPERQVIAAYARWFVDVPMSWRWAYAGSSRWRS